MSTKKQAFLFYATNLEVLEQFDENRAKKLVLKIVEYGFKTASIDCTEEEEFILSHIFEGIDAQKQRYEMVQRLEEISELVEALPRKNIKFRAEDAEVLLKALKKLKAQAHRESVEELQIYNVLGPELYAKLSPARLAIAGEVFLAFRGRIRRVVSEDQRKDLESKLNDILAAFCLPLPHDTETQSDAVSKSQPRPFGKYVSRMGTPIPRETEQKREPLPTPDPSPFCPKNPNAKPNNLFTSF